jgi:hypothetical protein
MSEVNKRKNRDDDDNDNEDNDGGGGGGGGGGGDTTKRVSVRRTEPGGDADCDGRSVPDGFLYHVVGAEASDGPGAAVILLVRPGAPACWTYANAGFFVGRHVAKILPDVPQYVCAAAPTAKAAASASRRRTIPVKCPTTSSYAWPAYGVDFESVPGAAQTPLLLSKFYSSLVAFAVRHMPDIAVFLKSGSADFKSRDELDRAGDSRLAEFFCEPDVAPLRLELPGVNSPLLLTTHCLLLDRDIALNPGPAQLVGSIPPIMRHDGMPDAPTLERWADLTRLRCQTTNDPFLAWGAATLQFGEGAHARQKTMWDIVGQQVTSATAFNKSRNCSHHDAWIETAFRVASIPFVAFLLKRRGVTMPEQQLPLADMPAWGRAHEQPLVTLHPLAPKRVFNIAAVLASVISHTELLSSAHPQVRARCCDGGGDRDAGSRNLREVCGSVLHADVGDIL